MDSERWRQIERLYQAALEREPSQRSAFLGEACRDDEELRREVESRLRRSGGEAAASHAGDARRLARSEEFPAHLIVCDFGQHHPHARHKQPIYPRDQLRVRTRVGNSR